MNPTPLHTNIEFTMLCGVIYNLQTKSITPYFLIKNLSRSDIITDRHYHFLTSISIIII